MSYLPKTDSGKSAFLENLAMKLPLYAKRFGMTSAALTMLANDAASFRWFVAIYQRQKEDLQQWTAFKNLLRDGPEGEALSLPFEDELPEKPEILATSGIFRRIARLVTRLKAHSAYTETIGEDLGILGPGTVSDLSQAKPKLTLTSNPFGHTEIHWKRAGYDAVEIEVDRDGEGFRFLAIDTIPSYTDTHPLPSIPVLWKYRAIYRLRDEPVGQWSEAAEIIVRAKPLPLSSPLKPPVPAKRAARTGATLRPKTKGLPSLAK